MKFTTRLITVCLLLICPSLSFPHPGGLSEAGCHYNAKALFPNGKTATGYECHKGPLTGLQYTTKNAVYEAYLSKLSALIAQGQGMPANMATMQDVDALRLQVYKRLDGTIGELRQGYDAKISGLVADMPSADDVDKAIASQGRIEEYLKAMQGMNLQGNLIANYNFASGTDGFFPKHSTITAKDTVLTVRATGISEPFSVNLAPRQAESTRYRILVSVRSGKKVCVVIKESGPDHKSETCVETSPTSWTNVQIAYDGHAGEQLDAGIWADGLALEFQVASFYLVKD